MSKKVPYELPDGDFVKYVEQNHQQAILQANAEKEKTLTRLNTSITTDSTQDSLRKIREQHEHTLQSLPTSNQKNKSKGPANKDMSTRSTPNITNKFPQNTAPQSASQSSQPYNSDSTMNTNSIDNGNATLPRGSIRGTPNSNNQSTFDLPDLPPNNKIDRKLKKLKEIRAAFLTFAFFFVFVFFFGTEANVMDDIDSQIFAILIFIFNFMVIVVQIKIWNRRRILSK